MTKTTEVEAAGNAEMVPNDGNPSKNTFVAGAAVEEEVRDCVIIGGGIAGLAAAADLEEVGMDFVLLEAGTRTTQIACVCFRELVRVLQSFSWRT